MKLIRSILNKCKRRILTVISIAVGVILMLTINAVVLNGKAIITAELDNMGLSGIALTNDNGSGALSINGLETIRCISGVDNATPIVVTKCNLTRKNKSGQAIAWGIDAGSEQIISLEIINGRSFSDRNVNQREKVCILDSSTAEKIFSRQNISGEKIKISLSGNIIEYTVIGVAKAGSSLLGSVIGDYLPYVVYLPFTTIQSQTGAESFTQIAVNPKDNIGSEKLISRIKDVIGESGLEFENLSKQRDRLSTMLDMVTAVLSAIGGVSLIVAGLGNTTAMISSVREKTREIGIKKAIGASSVNIVLEFLADSIIISAAGSLLALSFFVCVIVIAHIININILVSSSDIIELILITVVIGVISAIYPAYKASNLKPVEAFNYI